MAVAIQLPMSRQQAASLACGDIVLLSGTIYTARDAAHKRLMALIEAGEPLPFDLDGSVIYYAGPTPAPPGQVIGSAGPTTSGRMDAYTPALLARGLRGMIGKGDRSGAVITAMRQSGAVYLGAVGGAGALLAQRVKTCDIIAFADLGPEAIYRLTVDQFPAVVIIDSQGRNLYQEGREHYLASLA